MNLKNIDEQKNIFNEYADRYINSADEQKINGYIDKKNHSVFVLEEAMLIDALFTEYNDSFKNLLALESLFHDIGRFEQLKVTSSFKDNEIKDFYSNMNDHGDLGSEIIKTDGLLKKLIPDVRIYDEEVQKVIKAHSKINPEILNSIMMDYIKAFKNYDLKELFLSSKADKEKEILFATNTSIIQDVDRLDIFRKIVKGIWIPATTNDVIDNEIFQMFLENRLPSMNEIKQMGKWNSNVGHLVRLSFINQMNLIPVLKKVREENLLEKIYEVHGKPQILSSAYEAALEKLDKAISSSEDGVIVSKHK